MKREERRREKSEEKGEERGRGKKERERKGVGSCNSSVLDVLLELETIISDVISTTQLLQNITCFCSSLLLLSTLVSRARFSRSC